MFTLIRQTPVPAFGLQVFEYRHQATEARHIHLQLPGELHAFDLSFRTLPSDEGGVAHILEHCVLEGSRRFPVPGMFHKRSSSSFSAFSNAQTGRDQTSYLFHTPLRKDFDQLLEMYLDACFFPLLAPETFAQEGHRLEPVDSTNPVSPLQISGVVFNEMKANYANPVSRVVRGLLAALYPGTPYALDSGGNPAVIPGLGYEQFLAFHRRYYCPANARFHYCGPLAPEELQERLEELVLGPLSLTPGTPAPRPGWSEWAPKPLEVDLPFPYSGQGAERMGLGVLAWRLGRNAGLEDELICQVLMNWLGGSSEAPLVRLILESGMGGPLTTLLNVGLEPLLLLGAQGMECAAMDANLDRLQAELERVADAPLDPALLRALTDQLLLEQRNTEDEDAGPGAFPMLLIDRVREAGRLEQDPLERLNPALVLERLRGRLCDPYFMRAELRARVLEPSGLVRLRARPDDGLGLREAEAERALLAGREASLDAAARAGLAQAARRLQLHREDHSRDGMIPLLHLDDVDRGLVRDPLESFPAPGLLLRAQSTATNGLCHLDLEVEVPPCSAEAARAAHWLGYLPEFGYGDLSHEQADLRRRSLGAPLEADYQLFSDARDADRLQGSLRLRGHCAADLASDYAEMMRLTLEAARLDDDARWQQFLRSRATDWRRNAAGPQVHSHLWQALGAAQSRQGWLQNQVHGFPGLRRLWEILGLEETPALLEQIRTRGQVAARAPRQALLAADPAVLDGVRSRLEADWSHEAAPVDAPLPEWREERAPRAWLTDSTVCYAGISWRGLPRAHPDWPLLRVAAGLLESQYLHTRIREQGGAYGAFAQSANGCFHCSTYRDPRLRESLEDLRGVWDWLQSAEIPARKVEEAALASLKGLLLAQSPVARVRLRLERERQWLDQELLEQNIRRLRAVDLDELRAVARAAVDPASESVVVVCAREKLRQDDLQGFLEEEI